MGTMGSGAGLRIILVSGVGRRVRRIRTAVGLLWGVGWGVLGIRSVDVAVDNRGCFWTLRFLCMILRMFLREDAHWFVHSYLNKTLVLVVRFFLPVLGWWPFCEL